MPQQKTIDVKTTAYFTGTMLFLGVVLVIAAILILSESLGGAVFLLFLALIVFSTHYRLKIDFGKKEFHDYLWILGFKHGEKGKFKEIQYLFVKPCYVSQTMRLRAASSTVKKVTYDGYLRLSETEKIHLMTRDDKETVLEYLHKIAAKLHVRVIDYSESEHGE
jgi:hypothetical protein